MVVVVMGVSGAGKTTLGRRLATVLGWRFVEGDDLHAPAAIATMRRGAPLDDVDRGPWLDRLRAAIDDALARGEDTILTCSALTRAYRDRLGIGRAGLRLVYVHGPEDVLRARLRARAGHFVRDALLTSQLALLEPPGDAIVIDARDALEDSVDRVRAAVAP